MNPKRPIKQHRTSRITQSAILMFCCHPRFTDPKQVRSPTRCASTDKSISENIQLLEILEILDTRDIRSISHVINKFGSAFNFSVKNIIVQLVKVHKKIIFADSQLKFLLNCRLHDIFPKHINNLFKSRFFHSNFAKRKFKYLTSYFQKKLLKLETTDKTIHLKFLRSRKIYLLDCLSTHTNKSISSAMNNYLDSYFYTFKSRHLRLLHLKLEKIIVASPYTNTPSQSVFHTRFDNNNANELKNKWLINLTDHVFPKYVTDTLSLGEKFNFSIDFDYKQVFEFFKCLENTIYLNKNADNKLRNDVLHIINSHVKNKPHISYSDKVINNNILLTKKFLKQNPNVFFTKADKGNATVAIEHNVYIQKVEEALGDDSYYIPLEKKNPINIARKKMTQLLKKWSARGVFECDNSFGNISLKLDNTNIPRAYALIKIHKENYPIRIIVSAINSPTYQFDKSISLLFNKFFPLPSSTIKNSTTLKNKLDYINIPHNYKLVSFDVVALFNNIPKNLILDAIGNNWKYLSGKINLSKIEFLEGINILLDCTYLQFNGKFYKQIMGAPMGFCTSPWFADLALERLESHCSNILKNNCLLYNRYVDDCILIVKEDKIDETLSHFNSFNEHLKFTCEIENQNKISFLDLEIIRKIDSPPFTNWYRKTTASGRYINFHSHHPFSQKIAIIYNLVDKAILLSHPSFHQSNISTIKNFLIANDYPLNIIEKFINKRLFHINYRNLPQHFSPTNKHNNNNENFLNKNIACFPFHNTLNNKLKSTLRKHNISLINKTTNKFNKYIRLGKDRLDKGDIANVVYKIDCKDCDSTYVGMTSRPLKKRQYEHQYCIKNKDDRSPLFLHKEETGHDFDFKKIKIIDNVKNNFTRRFSEMLHIHYFDNTLNRTEDTNFLKQSYKDSINLLKPPSNKKTRSISIS